MGHLLCVKKKNFGPPLTTALSRAISCVCIVSGRRVVTNCGESSGANVRGRVRVLLRRVCVCDTRVVRRHSAPFRSGRRRRPVTKSYQGMRRFLGRWLQAVSRDRGLGLRRFGGGRARARRVYRSLELRI